MLCSRKVNRSDVPETQHPMHAWLPSCLSNIHHNISLFNFLSYFNVFILLSLIRPLSFEKHSLHMVGRVRRCFPEFPPLGVHCLCYLFPLNVGPTFSSGIFVRLLHISPLFHLGDIAKMHKTFNFISLFEFLGICPFSFTVYHLLYK